MTQQQRLTERLLDYWQLVRSDSKFPDIAQFDHAKIPDLWPQCFMVSVDTRGGKIGYKYEYMGEPVVKVYGQDLTSMIVDTKMKQFPGSVVIEKLGDIVAQQEFAFNEGHLLNKDGRLIKYRACFLPFGNDKKGITHIVVGLSFRVF